MPVVFIAIAFIDVPVFFAGIICLDWERGNKLNAVACARISNVPVCIGEARCYYFRHAVSCHGWPWHYL